MPDFFTIKDGWELDGKLGSMLRELDSDAETAATVEFQSKLASLMQEYEIGCNVVVEWIERGFINSSRK